MKKECRYYRSVHSREPRTNGKVASTSNQWRFYGTLIALYPSPPNSAIAVTPNNEDKLKLVNVIKQNKLLASEMRCRGRLIGSVLDGQFSNKVTWQLLLEKNWKDIAK